MYLLPTLILDRFSAYLEQDFLSDLNWNIARNYNILTPSLNSRFYLMYSLRVFTARYNECYYIASNNWIENQDVTYDVVI